MDLKTLKTGDCIHLRLVLTKAEIRKTKANKPYLQATFSDGTDTVSGNIWDWAAALPELGVYDVSAVAGEYMGKNSSTTLLCAGLITRISLPLVLSTQMTYRAT